MMTASPVIITEQLTRAFGQNIAVNALNLTVNAGEIFGLLGHNGAGKTTTVRLLNGVLNPTSGKAQVLGLSPVENGAELRRQTGVLTETPSLYEQLSARENLSIFADFYGVPRADVSRRIDQLLTLFDLQDRAAEKVGGYSKGMKQRLALARAFLHEPQLLFLDEPAAGLDPVAAKQVNDLILHLSREEKKTILLATHNLHDAQRLCDRVAVMEHGRVIATGTPAELAQQIRTQLRVELELDADQINQAAGLLKDYGVETISKTVLRVNGVHRYQIPEVLARLVQAGVQVYRLQPDEPTLEDVYFALQAKEVGV